jgi:predicted small metal-binding protein
MSNAGNGRLELPCGETISLQSLDLGMRELDCDCGEGHAVVMDMHPPTRFFPEFLVETLSEAVETTSDEMPDFGTPHLMGIVMEEFPEQVASADASEEGDVGFALVWITQFDSRRLHEVIVELVVELMEHAVSHAESEHAMTEFEEQMLDFDVTAFVEQYRDERDLDPEPYV